MKLVLPDFICEEDQELELNCTNLKELYQCLMEVNSDFAEKLFESDSVLNKNVILVMDDKIVKKGSHAQLEFRQDTILEVLLQLAGG